MFNLIIFIFAWYAFRFVFMMFQNTEFKGKKFLDNLLFYITQSLSQQNWNPK